MLILSIALRVEPEVHQRAGYDISMIHWIENMPIIRAFLWALFSVVDCSMFAELLELLVRFSCFAIMIAIFI